MATETLVVKHENTTLDLLLWRRFKRHFAGMAERTLDINPGLAAGVFLPIGREVIVELPVDPSKGVGTVVTLWD